MALQRQKSAGRESWIMNMMDSAGNLIQARAISFDTWARRINPR
jgi:hypothetical protein